MLFQFFRTTVASALLLTLCIGVAKASETDEGWVKLLLNNDQGAVSTFNTALEQNPADTRANLGMAYAYSMRKNNRRTWEFYQKAILGSTNPHAYIYAAIANDWYGYAITDKNSGLEEILMGAIEKPDSLGIVRAMIYENLGSMELSRGNIEKSKEWFAKVGAITTWRMIGPFHNVSASGHDKVFAPEKKDEPNSSYEGASGCRVDWFVPSACRIDSWVDDVEYFPFYDGVFYHVVYIRSEKEQRVHMRLGTSGAYKLFLNDSLVSEALEEYNNDLDTYLSEVTLAQGWNKVLVKIDNSELQRCNFLLRITDKQGAPIEGLEVSTQPQTYTKADPRAVAVANPFLAYFEDQIARYPEHIENYLLLADCYLRNDNVSSAEHVLRQVAKKHPDFICALTQYIDMYARGRRQDDRIITIERITTLRPDLPVSIVYKFRRDMESEKIDEAEATLKDLQRALPGSSEYFDAAIEIARKRNRIDELNNLIKAAFEAHPGNTGYAAANIVLAMVREGRHAEANAIADRHLQARYSAIGLLFKANINLNDGKIELWKEYMQKALDIDPTSASMYEGMAETYTNRNDYREALEIMKKMIAIAPTNSRYWYAAGTLHKTIGATTEAIAAYENSLAFNPANFEARESLRELRGQPSPFANLSSFNIDSLVKAAPTYEQFPEDDAIYLLDDQKRVVLDGSRCEVQYEMLIRVFSKDGIDQYKETNLPGAGSYSLKVEKAVVRKPNGREIPADVSGGQAVFKGLEEGDFIYMKTRDREYRVGRLSKYFADKFYFNSYKPVKISRYTVVVPENTDFQYQMSNSPIEPVITSADGGSVYMWDMRDMPAIESEEGMPDLDDIGIVLNVTSIKDWSEIVEWYYDIARTKTRPTIEIKELVDSLFPPTQKFSKQQLVEGVYSYITTNIRYSNVSFRQSGIVPQKARDVLLTRIGDCKDVATLCISMLAERGIDAYHVLVQTYTSALARKTLPSDDFDHAIVFVDLGEKGMFIDLTADDVPVGSLPAGDLDAFSLVIKPGWKTPMRLHRVNFTPSNVDLTTSIALNTDLSARITQTVTHTGSRTQWYRSTWKTATKKEIEKQLNEWLADDFADAKLESYELKDVDVLKSSLSYSITFTVQNYASEAGDFTMVKIPWYSPFMPKAALSYDARKYPYEFGTGIDTLHERVVISVPAGYQSIGSHQTNEFSHDVSKYSLSSKVGKDGIEYERELVTKRRIVMPTEYADYKAFFNKVVRADRQSVLLAPKGTTIKVKSVK